MAKLPLTLLYAASIFDRGLEVSRGSTLVAGVGGWGYGDTHLDLSDGSLGLENLYLVLKGAL